MDVPFVWAGYSLGLNPANAFAFLFVRYLMRICIDLNELLSTMDSFVLRMESILGVPIVS